MQRLKGMEIAGMIGGVIVLLLTAIAETGWCARFRCQGERDLAVRPAIRSKATVACPLLADDFLP